MTTRLMLFLLVCIVSIKSFAACVQVAGMELPELQPALSDPRTLDTNAKANVDVLRLAYKRIAYVSKINPALVLCDDDIVNAIAAGSPNHAWIVFYGGLARILKGNIDEVAAVMAHEFAHVLLNHTAQKGTAITNITYWAKQIGSKQYKTTGRVDEAENAAVTYFRTGLAAFTLEKEREADQKGFSLAVTLANYKGEGFKSLALKFSKENRPDIPSYLQDHPGWFERLDKAEILTVNQYYIDLAKPLLVGNNFRALEILVRKWLREIPSSPAAWYYNGLLLIRHSKNAEKVALIFEKSVSLYVVNKELGALSQEDQSEKDNAWIYLCIALFDEGYKYESARCSTRIKSREGKDAFQNATFHGLFAVGGVESSTGSIWVSRKLDGGKLITNDVAHAANRSSNEEPNPREYFKLYPRNYYELAPQWRAIRFPANREEMRTELVR